MSERRVDVADLFEWLPDHRGMGSLVTSLPDANELGMDSLPAYLTWLAVAIDACLAASAGPAVFLQTDRLGNGATLSKAGVVISRAAEAERPLIWHKVVCRRAPGKLDLHRPTYSHLLAIGPGRVGRRTPDVIGPSTAAWANGAPVGAARAAAAWLSVQEPQAVLNPCCGSGMFLAAVEAVGLDGYGCDLNASLAATARTARLEVQR